MSGTTSTTTTSAQQQQHTCAVCQKVATSKCSRCKMIWYCSVEHQKQDWKRHKPTCSDTHQADQHTLHKLEFDRIIQAYGLDKGNKPNEIAELLTQTDANGAVSAPVFATKFGMKVEEAIVFLEWIKVGIQFKEQAIDTAKKSGFSNNSSSEQEEGKGK